MYNKLLVLFNDKQDIEHFQLQTDIQTILTEQGIPFSIQIQIQS